LEVLESFLSPFLPPLCRAVGPALLRHGSLSLLYRIVFFLAMNTKGARTDTERVALERVLLLLLSIAPAACQSAEADME
jgi:hypothetical protein